MHRRRRRARLLVDRRALHRGIGIRAGGVLSALLGHAGQFRLVGESAGRQRLDLALRWASGAIRPGDEIITPAAAFPTTVNPILQIGAVPVFIDVELGTYVPTLDAIAAAIGPKTRGVMIAHTMGVPFNAAGCGRVVPRSTISG